MSALPSPKTRHARSSQPSAGAPPRTRSPRQPVRRTQSLLVQPPQPRRAAPQPIARTDAAKAYPRRRPSAGGGGDARRPDDADQRVAALQESLREAHRLLGAERSRADNWEQQAAELQLRVAESRVRLNQYAHMANRLRTLRSRGGDTFHSEFMAVLQEPLSLGAKAESLLAVVDGALDGVLTVAPISGSMSPPPRLSHSFRTPDAPASVSTTPPLHRPPLHADRARTADLLGLPAPASPESSPQRPAVAPLVSSRQRRPQGPSDPPPTIPRRSAASPQRQPPQKTTHADPRAAPPRGSLLQAFFLSPQRQQNAECTPPAAGQRGTSSDR